MALYNQKNSRFLPFVQLQLKLENTITEKYSFSFGSFRITIMIIYYLIPTTPNIPTFSIVFISVLIHWLKDPSTTPYKGRYFRNQVGDPSTTERDRQTDRDRQRKRLYLSVSVWSTSNLRKAVSLTMVGRCDS